jgi:pimeloyl-ACP methyl ester carboxylesterase
MLSNFGGDGPGNGYNAAMSTNASNRGSGFGEVVGAASAPPALLLGGPPGIPTPWAPLVAALSSRLRFYRWSYEFAAGQAAPGPAEHAAQVATALDGAGLDPVVVLAWDVGAQVALELNRIQPGRVRALVLLNGVFGATYRPAARLYALGTAALRGLGHVRRLVGEERLAPLWADEADVPRALKLLRVVARPTDDAEVTRLVRGVLDADAEVLAAFTRPFATHRVTELLPLVTAPTLLITGERDRLSPPHVSMLVARELAAAEVFVVRDGTHVVTTEYPEAVSLRVEKFLRERGVS